ncbi:Outer membrane protein TolC [Chitinophaga sp. CF118]|uniref:TolC family protein n=1 Tax=Chitinophaga sp. CF118 TaxID=1884367 RepID=UPI0008EE1927|nr:TolC family protein [Chitinophaga sp. CF118]SFD23864.1 Outer membrane protein TolC [Chitinophaga sp. CF118]
MNRRIISILLLGFSPCIAAAQQTKSLKDCISYGLAHHISKGVYANEILSAKYKSKEALAGYLPSVNVSGSLDDNLKLQESIIPAGLLGPTDTHITFGKKFNSNTSIQLDQTIYDQSLIAGLKANKLNIKQAELNNQQNDETIIYNICSAYYQIFVYREQMSLLKDNLNSYDEQLKISRLKVNKGVATEVDLNKIQVNYNNTYSQILVAESNLAVSENQLKNVMGFPLDEKILIDSVSGINSGNVSDDPNLFNAEYRTDYKLSGLNISLLTIDQKRIRAGALPKLTAYGRYGAIGFGDNLSQSYSGLSDFSAIGLKLSIPIFDGFKRHAQYTQAKYKRLNAVKNQQLDKENYKLEFENAHTKLLKAKNSMEYDRRNIELAQSVFESTDMQYQKGVTDLTDWLNAQTSLKEAQTNYLNSLYNFYLASIDLEKANGTLIKFYNAL